MAGEGAHVRSHPAAPSEPPDLELVSRIRGGDPDAFERLMRRYNQRVFRAARSILRNDTEAEDVVQETFVRAYRHLGDFEGRASVATWLCRIAVHDAMARVRRSRLFSALDVDEENERAPAASSPEEQVKSRELRSILTAAIDALPSGLRTVFVLRDVEGVSTLDVCEILELSPEAVRVRLHRARSALRRHVEKELGVEARNLFAFAGSRCDRIVTGVFGRLGLTIP